MLLMSVGDVHIHYLLSMKKGLGIWEKYSLDDTLKIVNRLRCKKLQMLLNPPLYGIVFAPTSIELSCHIHSNR